MRIRVETDPDSGFCGGVIRAIGTAERYLSDHPDAPLYSLGSIVHNEAELARLASLGMHTASKHDLNGLKPGTSLLIRAHGEPPETYSAARNLKLDVIDCTCPVVLQLQKQIRLAYDKMHAGGHCGQLVIFGKVGHAEVLGLVGQVGGDAVVVQDLGMLCEALADGRIRTDMRTEIFSQTTKSPDEYSEICSYLASAMSDRSLLKVHDTICSQVATRHEKLSAFARNHDIIIFVSGTSSSNGAVLFDMCKSLNPRAYHVSGADEISREWFRDGDFAGVCGATSTPKWLLDEVASYIELFAI